MIKTLLGIFVILHGLVHVWYFVLSQRLVEYQASMGWTGKSWLLTGALGDQTTRLLAGGLYILAALAFVVSGVGVIIQPEWWRPALMGAAILSSIVIIIFWDGSLSMPVEKGLIGLVINLALLAAFGVFKAAL